MNYVWKLLTSFPMRVVDPVYFVDVVSGKPVLLCEDKHGRRWMANHRWDLNRIASKN